MTTKFILIGLLMGIFAYLGIWAMDADEIMVTTCDFASLQSTIERANGLDEGVIQLDCEGIIVFSRQISITGNVHLIGNEGVTFDGMDRTRLFYVGSGASLTLDTLTIQNGYTTEYGGAVLNDSGALIIHNSLFTGNSAEAGGAIYNFGMLTITDSHFMWNEGQFGAVIYNDEADVTITNTYFAVNEGYHGVAIYNDGGNITLISIKLYDNYHDSQDTRGSILFNSKDALMDIRSSHIYSPAVIYGNIVNDNGVFLSQDTYYSRVRCEVGIITDKGGNAGCGFGFDNFNIPTNVVVSNCNRFWGTGSILEAMMRVSQAGGEITFSCTGTIHFLYELNIIENISIWGNGNIIFDGSDKTRLFRTAYLHREFVYFDGLTFQNAKDNGKGGAIESTGNLIISNCTFVNNEADWSGGAIYHHGTLIIEESTFVDNRSQTRGGAIFAEFNFATDTALVITTSTFTNNSTQGDMGGAIAIDPFYSNDVNNAIITTSTFTNNTAQMYGGAISVDNRDVHLTLTNTVFTNNTAGEKGGALWLISAFLIIQDSTFNDNTATLSGGAVYHERGEWVDGAVSSENSVYTNNTCASEVDISDLGGNVSENADGCPHS